MNFRIVAACALLFIFSILQSTAYSAQKEQLNTAGITKQKFSKIQEFIKDGKVRFIGEARTFKIKANPILSYRLKEITGDVIPKNIRQIATEQRKIANQKKAIQKEFIKKAIVEGIDLGYLNPREMLSCPKRSKYDWRSYGKVTPVKNQGACGSCTTFGTLGAYEGSYAVQNNSLVDSAEQHLLSCSSDVSCSGGSRAALGEYMVNTGTSTETGYPYTASNSACNGSVSTPYNAVAWDYVSDAQPTNDELKTALCEYGPIAIGFNATPTFQAYGSGIFNELTSSSSNHAMTLVGWDDSQGGYWIVKNSWGTSWGESGYARIAYGSNSVGRWANWVQAPLLKIMTLVQWFKVFEERKVPERNRYIHSGR